MLQNTLYFSLNPNLSESIYLIRHAKLRTKISMSSYVWQASRLTNTTSKFEVHEDSVLAKKDATFKDSRVGGCSSLSGSANGDCLCCAISQTNSASARSHRTKSWASRLPVARVEVATKNPRSDAASPWNGATNLPARISSLSKGMRPITTP